MSDKLTNNEIIKALECCGEEDKCKECPYYNKGNFKCLNYKFFKDLLDLINRQQTNNEKLNTQKNVLAMCWKNSLKELRLFKTENKRLRAEKGSAKSEAVKEFAERLKVEFPKMLNRSESAFSYLIDNLVKEMVGEKS